MIFWHLIHSGTSITEPYRTLDGLLARLRELTKSSPDARYLRIEIHGEGTRDDPVNGVADLLGKNEEVVQGGTYEFRQMWFRDEEVAA